MLRRLSFIRLTIRVTLKSTFAGGLVGLSEAVLPTLDNLRNFLTMTTEVLSFFEQLREAQSDTHRDERARVSFSAAATQNRQCRQFL